MDFLPITIEDMRKRGWEKPDFVYITGDAYVDHPSFGPAIISRVLEANGYKVAMIPQPDWKNRESIMVFGEPRLGFLISGGNMDSMVNHYSVSKKRRQTDAYTPGGVIGKRPDHATIVYGNLVRQVYPDSPVIIGGIEASLRRLAHYDYWDNKVKRSILLDSRADIISYGMGERSIVEIADALNSGIPVSDITFIEGTVYKTKSLEGIYDYILLPGYDEIKEDKETYAKSFYTQYTNTDPFTAKKLIEVYDRGVYVVQNTPGKPLSREEMDFVYGLDYMRTYHPSYEEAGGIPAIAEVKFSLVHNRGCYGACNFCALTFHQGRIMQSRSHESVIEEAKKIVEDPDFKGYIHDVGGPTANFRDTACDKQLTYGACKERQCLFPNPCKNLKINHEDYLNLLRKLRNVPKVKKVFVRSGIRFDYLIHDKDDTFFKELCEHHVSGQLKVAPEHICDEVLTKMGKPENRVYEEFQRKFKEINQKLGKKQFLVPYLMSSHPGSDLNAAIELAQYVKKMGYTPEQVQDFYPTPGSLSTTIYYTGFNPLTGEKVYTPKTQEEKNMQRALIQFAVPKNYEIVKKALIKAGRTDLIGNGKDCLIPSNPPRQSKGKEKNKSVKINTNFNSSSNVQTKKKPSSHSKKSRNKRR